MKTDDLHPTFSYHKSPPKPTADKARRVAMPRIIADRVVGDVELTIADDAEFGCDPYNSTGQHVILHAKKERS